MDAKEALELVDTIQSESKWHDFRLAHVQLVRDYLLELNKRMEFGCDVEKLQLIGLLHDVLKERSSQTDQFVESHTVPWDLNDYVRRNLMILQQFGLDEYFNSDVQLHPLAGGIFLRKEFYIDDPEILYPIMFHSCPVMEVYHGLDAKIQTMIDMAMLADKLSSNWLRINGDDTIKMGRNGETAVDLDLLVFGETGKELHYTMGLYVAKLLGNGKRMDGVSLETTNFYYQRLCHVNPMAINLKLGGKRKWPKRKNLSLQTP